MFGFLPPSSQFVWKQEGLGVIDIFQRSCAPGGQHARESMADTVLKMKRQVSIKYCSLDLLLPVTSWEEDWIRG